jgi:O-methyltransferase
MEHPIRTKLCLEHLRSVINIPGDIIELGVGMGTTTFPLALALKGSGKKLYACDTFVGLPYKEDLKLYPEDIQQHALQEGECKGSLWLLQEMIRFYEVKDIVIPIEGLFENTLQKLEAQRFCFAWLDADLYLSTLAGYRFLEDRISSGGVLGFHDYKYIRCPGVDKVVDEVLDRNKFERIEFRDGCIFFRRK